MDFQKRLVALAAGVALAASTGVAHAQEPVSQQSVTQQPAAPRPVMQEPASPPPAAPKPFLAFTARRMVAHVLPAG